MSKQILDGCTAAAHVAFALSEVATIYPITPIASMGETAKKWGMQGRNNLWGQALDIHEMESELGAAGAMHGALAAGSFATTFTASQGLMLMIPNMYKIAGELLPGVIHVGCRSLATHALSIFGDHQDVMACRATGFTMLVSASVQETMDLALVAHLAAIDGSLPVLHFFDGWRTSSEMDTIDVIDYESMRGLVNWDNVAKFRKRAMNPEHPDLRGSAQNPDVYFQNREAPNKFYNAFPSIVQNAMDKVASITGRQYHTVDYIGDADAENIVVIMGSGAEVVKETVDYLNKTKNYKTGIIVVRLYRPFPVSDFVKAIPENVKTIAVLDRTKEPGAQHEPLCQDVISAVATITGRSIKVAGGRYGLSSKEFNPSMVKAILDEMQAGTIKDTFTVGINDDITHLSIDVNEEIDTNAAEGMYQSIFYGIGNDGTVGGTKQVASILGGTESLYAQAYFSYSAKKSGGYTISQLRIADKPVTSAYSIYEADYVACHKSSYVNRFSMVDKVKEGGIFVLNSPWTPDQMVTRLPLEMRKTMAEKKIKFYNIDADKIASQVGLLPRINMPMETVFLYLSRIIDFNTAYNSLKDTIRATYIHEGGTVVEMNLKAISMVIEALKEIDYNSIEGWTSIPEQILKREIKYATPLLQKFIEEIHTPCIEGKGDSIPVSAFTPDGTMPMGTSAYEHRRIATRVPVWDVNKCIECTECSLVCPHAAIRPYVLNNEEASATPKEFKMKAAKGVPELNGYMFHIQNFTEDCLGCSSCSIICPGHALTMTPIDEVLPTELPIIDWVKGNISLKRDLLSADTIKGSQLQPPNLEFSGACAGCGETPYVKLLTQLFGQDLIIANATGCSSIWGANYPSNAYCSDPDGKGPAWGNSLFEDNAEYGYGMLLALRHRRERAMVLIRELIDDPTTSPFLKTPLEALYSNRDSIAESKRIISQLLPVLSPMKNVNPKYAELLEMWDILVNKTVWTIGGDGWAYDIDFGGLDHVLASGDPVKILVMDTECYSNTGGQSSKATPRSAVVKYAPDGKRTQKKDIGVMMMSYGNVYVASVALGANYQQTINALVEAQNYPGPAIVIAYCPCITHGIRPGLGHSIVEERRAVESGYWNLYRFNPLAISRGEEPLTIDFPIPGRDNSGTNGSIPETASPRYPNPEPVTQVGDYIMNEDRYADLKMVDSKEAGILQPELQKDCDRIKNMLNDIKQ